MKEHIVTAVGIRHHRIVSMPHFMRMPTTNVGVTSHRSEPINVPRSIFLALGVSGVFWAALIAALSF